ncbi:hypothetical protein GOP47_0010157 [Adiantum capillus-veneris]|uniref:Bidirectional sugar transporter SWEET n=1 Tax=Adiantum capillus-veneris TaxID=13818 RepID=A0A9D4UU98_ADICA|nr:hypothetical protein GOP47_0010157 [Adiantum capillus-veneris]
MALLHHIILRHHHHPHLAIHVLGVLGNIASVTFFLASLPSVLKMVRTKSACAEDVVSAVNGQMVRMMTCCMWMVYACVRGQFALWILLTNSLGCGLSLAFLIPFFYFSPCPQRRHALKKLIVTSCALGITVGIMLWLLESKSSRIKAMGIISGIFSSLIHLGLLSQVKEALAYKDQSYLKPHASILAFIKGGTWVAYGLLSMDIYIMIPNGVGVLTGCVQMLLGCMLSCMRKKCPIIERTLSLRVEVFLKEETSKNDVTIQIKIPQQETFTSIGDSTHLERVPSPSTVSITVGPSRLIAIKEQV